MGALPFAFSAPLMLTALALLPVIWWLLRVTPPRPRRIDFPPLKIARDLIPQRQTPSQTPWWLLALRLVIAGLAILAVAGPFIAAERAPNLAAKGPLLVLMDNGFLSARDWPQRVTLAEARILAAGQEGRGAAVVGLGEAPGDIAISPPAQTLEKLRALAPRPHALDRTLHLKALDAALQRWPDAEFAWISDGATLIDAAPFLARMGELAKGGQLTLHADPQASLALAGADNQSAALLVKVLRTQGAGPLSGKVKALDAKGLSLGDAGFSFGLDATEASARFQMPIELRNAVTRLEIEGERSAGAVALIDERARRRRVGVVSGVTTDTAQPLLSPTYYITRALSPFAELREPASGATDPIGALIQQNLSVLVLADVGALDRETQAKVSGFVEKGGLLLRFAGPRLASGGDALSPVRLRRGGRSLGGALSWEAPKALAPFARPSPFEGLTAPQEVKVTRQILAEPDADLPGKVWASLADGTPVVTAERRGDGLIVLFHVTADTTWSNLPLSGLFVDMLRRIVTLAGTPAEASGGEARIEKVSPQRILDGYGVLRAAPATAQPVARGSAERGTLANPPGFYGAAEALTAINALAEGDRVSPLPLATLGVPVQPIAGGAARDLRPPLLTLALILLMIDACLTLWLGGRLRLQRRMATAAGLLLAALVLVAGGREAAAQAAPATPAAPAKPITRAMVDAAKVTRLAYALTGDRAVDEVSRTGLIGLTQALATRTALEPGDPIGLDPARDDIALVPLLYWPVIAGKPTPQPETLRKLDAFMKGGGMVVFDTRDALVARPSGPPTPEGQALRQMLTTLDVPELETIPRDHVLTKTFYLVDSFPGRYATGQTWTETLPPAAEDGRRPARSGDSVSPLIITSNDLAAAWAVGPRGDALYPLTGADPRQREMALRGGINIVMYALTGNYKADQVHVPALLERLGQ